MTTPEGSPTLTEQQRIAYEIRDELNALAARIPRLEHPHSATSGWVRAYRTVTEESIIRMIALVEQFDIFRDLGTFDVAEARETLQFADAFKPIADQVAALLAALNYTMEARKARVVAAGLRTYAVAKELARDNKSLDLRFALDALRTEMRRTRSRRQKEPT
jgi:hypothetical protein